LNFFAKNISYLRKVRGITQAEVPNYVDITRGTWSNYELGKTEPTLDQLISIAKFLRVSLQELLCEDLSTKGNLTENPEKDVSGNLIGNGKGNLYAENRSISFANEPGDLTVNSSHKEVIEAINRLTRDLDAMRRLKDK
jgi:transcriptional regulator with XRE-family HTH domain